MNILQILQQLNISPGTAVLLVVGLCALCLVLPLILSGVHVITGVLGLFTHLITGVTHVVSGGPVAWCGCLVAIGGCGFLIVMVWLIANLPASCAVHPTNFCALFGH